ncbi:hypothetical protein SAMN00120144_3543 [Hymenobacter roseosalivarius DSM 11622]|uniref:Lipocalin-like domain-containing protein n=1 Tax=Hymenobacter roseosalivarius DSM 11622 TaxID=645990 RepID=A0A1W1VJ22_9BACT|nr:hypothetical protein [Hymenobacter roseosalivarius]SMB93379.1 hypothetical protein SAMN00120144_3543 [Hymenobacter roseosalivarius DSM 11622]
MFTSLLSRFLVLCLACTILGCSSKEKEAVVPVKSLVGRWDVLEASVTSYEPDGRYLSTRDLAIGSNRYYVFSAEGIIEPYTKNIGSQPGFYSNTNNSLSLSFSYGTFQYTIPPTISNTELTLIEDTRNLATVPESRRNKVVLVHLKKYNLPD